jgi:hypothetical protein
MGFTEMASGLLPYPWGDQFELALKAIGGHVWFQITVAIIVLRVVAWIPAVFWRRRRSKGTIASQRLRSADDTNKAGA